MVRLNSVTQTSSSHKPSFLTLISKKASSLINLSIFQKKSSKEKTLQTIESRKISNPNQALVGQENHPAVKALLSTNQSTIKLLPTYQDKDLYGASGNPQGKDINQDGIGDCYFVATLGTVADQQPATIKKAIQYDSKTGDFTVTLHDKKGKAVKIKVTQAELQDNLKRGGGSTVDNNPGTKGPIWPAVMETAYAKMHDKKPSDGLDQGYQKIEGGWPKNAMRAITGKEGEVFQVKNSKTKNLDHAYDKIKEALNNHQGVTLCTKTEKKGMQDGLVDYHAYSVEGIRRDSNGEVIVTLRNPWGHNSGVGEGKDGTSAVIEVKLKDLVNTKGLSSINIGPATEKISWEIYQPVLQS